MDGLLNNEDLVWYASYGSNISISRFLCYIQGGTIEGSAGNYKGCSDKTLPLRDESVRIPHEVYFARRSSKWDGGVAFLRGDNDDGTVTFGRKSLIKRSQFLEVVSQENDNAEIQIDFERAITPGGYTFMDRGWYNHILPLGEQDGFPILTFTAAHDQAFQARPSEAYLRQITTGLKETYEMSADAITDYLIGKEGIVGLYTHQELLSIATDHEED